MLRILLIPLFQAFVTVKSGSHSLWALSTFIMGDTPFPDFSAVVMLDDIQLFYYDANLGKTIYGEYRSEHVREEQEDARNIFGEQHHDMKEKVLLSSQKLNSTHETASLCLTTRSLGGELLPNGDGTYQMRKSLEVSADELQQHHYTCTAEHLSQDNKLDFGLGK
ncbi:hypothetical protein ACEWY4_012112 [Coilia grayii]|uniref:MHC class I-like antigen recognition-like domain-containing protein n=1 Tax=Coilia grayii TaxID=363190 RepID=A0ABD1JZJ7_9TELE